MSAEAGGDYESARPSRFKIKSKKRARDDDDSGSHKRRRSHETRERSPRSKWHKAWDNVYDDPASYDDTYEPNARTFQYEDPDAAFRESLFDAMADDEGAAYWEGVYGQPIHVFERPESQGADGGLGRMNDEEYAEYVRTKMWEKTHQHVLEERERREQRKKREAEEKDRQAREGDRKRREHEKWQSMVEESLRAGEKRRKGKRWKEAWDDYLRGWQSLPSAAAAADDEDEHHARRIIPWPVVTGRWKDVTKENVEDFFDHAPDGITPLSHLKIERVRWHPDKMQQRFGATKIDDDALRSVTAVFQVVDRLWSDMRDRS